MKVIENLESRVRSYSRCFPTVFSKAKGYKLWDISGREFVDFFAGAGALNYGHNNSQMQHRLLDYITNDGVAHSLDMATAAKEAFLQQFWDVILVPRTMNYKIMFPGPTGTNTVESSLKLARKVTGRSTVISFTNAFHGMTLGSLSVTGNSFKRHGAGVPLHYCVRMPFDGYFGESVNTLEYLERFLEDQGSGVSLPAAIILETIQAEGGINVASFKWLRQLEQLCHRYDILLIVDDVQVGCGRTGSFFSFESVGIEPDIICLSKSIGGYGLPMALTLIKPEYDIWEPGEHNGTFRGNNLAFVTATEALTYWETDAFSQEIQVKADAVRCFLERLVREYPELQGQVRGRGLIQGMVCGVPGLASEICAAAFDRGMIVETSGPSDEVVKLLPPLIIDEVGLETGFSILVDSVDWCLSQRRKAQKNLLAKNDGFPALAE